MDSDGVAVLLRELKERSGLSYGRLARRLHMSPSTVHRYCNSDAVPADFAPVERIARLCGADREELSRLHRSWIVADETRRRAKGARPEDATGTGTDGPEAAEPAVPPPGPGPERPPVRTDTEEPRQPEATLREPGPPVTRRRRRRVWALATTTVVVVLAALGAALVWPLTSKASRPDSPVGTGGSSPSPVGARPAVEPAGRGQSPRVPLTADVDPYVWKDPCSQVYVVDQPPEQVPPPPSGQDARGWVTALSGVPGGAMVIDVTLQGLGDEVVVLKALHVRVVATGEPLPGNAYVMGVGCGGEARLRSLDINLDTARPRPVPVAGHRGDRTLPATDFPYQVSARDPQTLRITAHTRARGVRWYLELDWTSGGHSGTLRLDNKGQPFTTSGTTGLPAYQFPLGADAWEPFQGG
ncbi:helix-turn-helix domain-containing protein [Streptomyces yaizuensis]|uniref:Transcriptional regulator n=1 Tax=Streptomyces yaizuensis TaxID=2989713 RepID=A0ABQ5NQG7_9ACTN|nr:helix-turn-helix transcriptional regulator [Streptomyces sp. YSPA8]GLF92621.1 transcriptional regulator [Streptomyces sp. YSPA8]